MASAVFSVSTRYSPRSCYSNLFKPKLCSSIGGWAVPSADAGGADGNVVLEPPNYGSGFFMAFKHHG